MACTNSSGEVTEMARKILTIMSHPVSLDDVAGQTGLALYRIRAAARELVEAGLAERRDEAYVITENGQAALAKTPSQG